MKPLFLTVAVLAVAMWTVGCSTPRNQPVFAPIPDESGASLQIATNRYVAGDLITISFSGSPDPKLGHIEQRINEDGMIDLPLLGAMKAGGKTPTELQNEVISAYVAKKHFIRLTVPWPRFEQFFYMQGQVRQPGRYPYSGEISVARAIQTAGGFLESANRKQVRLIREGDAIFIVNCDKIQKDPSQDLRILPGDQLHVPSRKWRWPFGK
ncbi:MAG: hypothetical protein HOP33_19285 [Verrucomicrobia bacterium]|nr:hypothetical protein [Verrucomicrobiota bacterium]